MDVISSDLNRPFNDNTEAMEEEEEEVFCEWTIKKPLCSPPHQSPLFSKYEIFLEKFLAKANLDRIRFDLTMACFHSWFVANSSGGSSVFPLDFCRSSTSLPTSPPARNFDEYKAFIESFDVACIEVCDQVSGHSVCVAQDKKDLERDSVNINGNLFVGAETGYEGIVNFLSHIVGNEIVPRLALSIANRTFSGGVAFDQVMRHFHVENLVSIAPISAQAEPLDIAVVPERCVLIRAHTRYALLLDAELGNMNVPKLPFIEAFAVAEIPLTGTEPRCYVFLEANKFK